MGKRSSIDIATGVIVINKHEGVTSHRIVQILRRLYNTSRVGHTGTLDPMATGVLPVLIGRAVKASDFLVEKDKEYVAKMKLGIVTDTEDITGEVLETSSEIPDEATVMSAVSGFQGEIMQIPPMYSAVKVGGQKLVDIAREGRTVDREPRKVHISSLTAKKLSDTEYELTVTCSKGTYIRTLCADIGKKLGCGAVMSSLIRTKSGSFDLSCAHTVEELEALSIEERAALVAPTETLFADCNEIGINDFYTKLIKGGTELYQKKLGTSFCDGEYIKIKHNGALIALGQVTEYKNGSAVKPVKLFEL